MIKVAVMGGIGSGKSFIAKLFKYPVFNADEEVKLIYKKDRKCFLNLKKKLPKLIKSFPVKKSNLIKAINSDKRNLAKISSVVHPLVRKKMEIFLKKNKTKKMIILDIPLFIENKLNKKGDVLIFINTRKSKVVSRLKRRKNYNVNILKELKKNQYTLLKKRKLANYIIDNNYPPNIMRLKIQKLKHKILNERNSS